MRWSDEPRALFFCILIWSPSVLFAGHPILVNTSSILQSFDAGYGTHAVPDEVVEMRVLATRNSVEAFNMDVGFLNNVLILQRAVEYLYPVRLDPGAKVLMAPAGAILDGCRPVDTGSLVALHVCQ